MSNLLLKFRLLSFQNHFSSGLFELFINVSDSLRAEMHCALSSFYSKLLSDFIL